MKTIIPFACFLLVGSLGAVAVADTGDEASLGPLLKEAELRLRAIYNRDEFRAERFRADWLSDSSGYTVLEPALNTKERMLVRYDAASGKRTVLDPTQKEKARRSGNLSPDGERVIVSEQGNLYVRDLSHGPKIPLTNSVADSSVSHRRAVWSPDGKRIVFVQSDDSRVKLRPVLVPDDPSYPAVKNVRFARVGETIPTLRVGVVDANCVQRWELCSLSQPSSSSLKSVTAWSWTGG